MYSGRIYKSCLSLDHHAGLNGYLDPLDEWHVNAPKYPSKKFLASLICNKPERLALTQIMPVLDTTSRLIYYDSCQANLYAAVRRQCTATPNPDDELLDKLQCYFEDTLMPEIRDLLSDFHYSFDVWYNHLDASQQLEIDRLDLDKLETRNANIFCKAEKQEIVNGELPKNRTISAMCTQHKYVMGPIIYSLEQYFKNFKGYCGGKTWNELGLLYDEWLEKGFTKFVQSDISGMDRSVKRRLMVLIEQIYDHLTPFVTHVDTATWIKHAFVSKTQIFATYYEDKVPNSLGYCIVSDKVFSGESSTTWKNTTINTIIMRFIMEKLLHLTPDQYGLADKGDDSGAALPSSISDEDVRRAFYQCYYPAKLIKHPFAPYYMRHGTGLTLKYLSISDTLTDADFCSTHTFYCYTCKHHRITRKIDRFLTLTPWSDTAHNLTPRQRLAYMHNLYLSNLKWCRGLPIFTQLNDKLRTNVTIKYTLNGKPRKHRPLNKIDQAWFEKMFDVKQLALTRQYQQQFGKNTAYSLIQQQTDLQPCCAISYRYWLSIKLGLDDESVVSIIKQLENINSDVYTCPLLSSGLLSLEQHFARTHNDTGDVYCPPVLAGPSRQSDQH